MAPLRSALLDSVPHGFSTRDGLEANDILPGAPLLLAKQVHSPDVATVAEAWDHPPEADALVTATPGLLIGVVTADCAPVLLSDDTAGVVGAAHAGWRGAHGGVIANTVAAMVALGAAPGNIRAAIGPTIAQESYEVDAAFREQFDASDARFFAPGRAGHWQFDLPAYVARQLEQAGIGRVHDLARDTYADADRFHSYRRATHRGVATQGRQTSVIGLP